MDIGYVVKNAKDSQKPQNHGDDNNNIQDGPGSISHRSVAINQP